jgi:hypothetical protein
MSDLIFGYTWDEIQKAQRGGKLQHTIVLGDSKITITTEEIELLKREGVSGLERLGFYGLLDRLKRSGFITEAGK